MLATSALFTSVSFLSLRMRPGAFVPIKWRLPECPRLILPLAVILKRFLAPRCVFNFNFGFDAFLGISGNPLLISVRSALYGACYNSNLIAYWGASRRGGRPYKILLARLMALVTATAGRWTMGCPPGWRTLPLVSGRG